MAKIGDMYEVGVGLQAGKTGRVVEIKDSYVTGHYEGLHFRPVCLEFENGSHPIRTWYKYREITYLWDGDRRG